MTGVSCLVCESEMVPHSWPGFLRCPTCSFISADGAYSDQELAELYLEVMVVANRKSGDS
jgi:ribosomal protein L37AE/L43A